MERCHQHHRGRINLTKKQIKKTTYENSIIKLHVNGRNCASYFRLHTTNPNDGIRPRSEPSWLTQAILLMQRGKMHMDGLFATAGRSTGGNTRRFLTPSGHFGALTETTSSTCHNYKDCFCAALTATAALTIQAETLIMISERQYNLEAMTKTKSVHIKLTNSKAMLTILTTRDTHIQLRHFVMAISRGLGGIASHFQESSKIFATEKAFTGITILPSGGSETRPKKRLCLLDYPLQIKF